ncbi:MAG: Malonyl CoA-acyl carrier protein transacylase [Dehalococcoidales bacterium]|nr:Malonyl CoA-acyl carrier protein transacylase [Dehalococcoidales bacterium]
MSEAKKVAYVFPGQGSQWVGMGRDLYDNFATAKALIEQADEVLEFPLSRLYFEGPEEELRQTINAQPALVAVSLACLKVIEEMPGVSRPPAPAFVAGHSLGEYTALAAAGVIDFATAVYLARERGRLMYEAGLKRPGGMVAIIGLDEASVAEVCDETDTQIANCNCPGQLVISGARENLAKAADLARARGASRTLPLPVSGAFHSALMQPAVDGITGVIARITFQEPTVPIIANTTATPLTTAEEIKGELTRQLCHGVQWQRSIEYMANAGITTFIEIGPGKVLSGLIKRINKNVETLNIGNVEAIRNLGNPSP